jgi:hypothetical protein
VAEKISVSSEAAIRNALTGFKSKQRLCFDFNTEKGLKEFFANTQKAGLMPSWALPVLVFSQDGSTVWIAAKDNKLYMP